MRYGFSCQWQVIASLKSGAVCLQYFRNISANQYLRHNLSHKQKTQVIRRNQVYFSSSNVSTDTTVIVKDQMLSEKFTFCFKITAKWNLTKSHATRLKSVKYKLM